jgi:hypothetical protein
MGLICPFLPSCVFVKCPSIRKMDGRGGGIEIASLPYEGAKQNQAGVIKSVTDSSHVKSRLGSP